MFYSSIWLAGDEEMNINEIAKTIGGMPPETLFVVLALAAIGLAAYAIYAVLSVAKGDRK